MAAILNRISHHAALAALSCGILLLSCSGNIVRTMIPSPILMQDERLDFSRVVLPESRTTEVSVLFATTRAPAPPDAPERYTSRAGDAVRVGIAQVQLGEPKWSFDDLVESDRTSRPEAPRPARVVSVEEFGIFGAPGSEAERQFITAVDHQLETSPNRSVVIYVPGFRATFDQVMILMGSWAHFLVRETPVIAFSWPTGTWVWNYLTDCPRARAFVPDIARLIALVGERSQAQRLNLVGFSCGSPLLADALVQLREAHPGEDFAALQRRYRIANAIFIAADIDLQTFARSHLPPLSEIALRTTVYLSENDGALKFAALLARASRLRRAHPRGPGDPGEQRAPSRHRCDRRLRRARAHRHAGPWLLGCKPARLQRCAALDGLPLRPGLARSRPWARPPDVDFSGRLPAARRRRGVRDGAQAPPRER